MPVSTPKIHYNKVIYGKDVKTKEFKKRKDLVLKNVDVDTNLPELPKTPLAALPVLETEDLYEFIEENKKKGTENSKNNKEPKERPRAASFHQKPGAEPKELTFEQQQRNYHYQKSIEALAAKPIFKKFEAKYKKLMAGTESIDNNLVNEVAYEMQEHYRSKGILVLDKIDEKELKFRKK